MLKNLDEQNTIQDLKQKWFLIQCVLNRSKFKIPLIINLLISFVIFIPIVSIFFNKEIFEPTQVNQVFKYLLLSQFESNFGIPQIIISIIVMIFCIIIIFLTIILFKSSEISSLLAKTYITMMSLFIFLLVPISQLMIFTIYQTFFKNQQFQVSQLIISILLGLVVILVTILGLIYTKLNFNPLRKNNIDWRLENNDQVYFYLLNIARVYVIVVDGISISLLVASIMCQIFRRYSVSGAISKINQIIDNNYSNLVIVTNFSVLISLAFNGPILGFQIWIIFTVLALIYTLIVFSSQFLKKFYIPKCTILPIQHYDFFFKIKEKISNNSQLVYIEKSFNQFINIHLLNCQEQKCYVEEWISREDRLKNINELEYLISLILNCKKNQSIFNQFLNQLWKCQIGNKFQFKQYQGKTLDRQYIESYSLNTSILIEKSSQIIESNSLMINKTFYTQIFTIAQKVSDFYEEVSKVHPRVESILLTGFQIQKHINKINLLFNEMIKNRKLNFKSIQLYLDTLSYFFNKNAIDNDIVQRLKKIQMANDIQDVNQSYLPCITVVLESGIIESSNMQILKFLQMNKYEIKGKYLTSLLLPQISYQKFIEAFQSQSNLSYLVFAKKHNNSPICLKISFRTKQMQGNKIGLVTLEKEPYSDKRSIVLVNQNFKIQSITLQNLSFKFNNISDIQMIDINCRQIFEENVIPIKFQLFKLQMIKISSIKGKPYLSLQINLSKTYAEDKWIVSMKFTKNYAQRASLPNNISFYKEQNNFGVDQTFSFRYDEKVNKVILRGDTIRNNFKYQVKKRKNQSFSGFDREMQKIIVNRIIIKKSSYAEGIKVYRLFDEDLYNIDLEDREAYNTLFDKHHSSSSTSTQKKGAFFSDYCLIFVIFLLSVILIILSTFLILEVRGSTSSIADDFKAGQNIQIFRIDFNRIMAVFRDVASGMYEKFNKDWIPDIKQSYNRIQQKQTLIPLFSQKNHDIEYNSQYYSGNLNELAEVIMSHIFEVIKKKDFSIIEYIHKTVIVTLEKLINQQKNVKFDNINSIINSTLDSKLNFIIVLLVGTILYYILMIMLCTRLTNNIKEKLSKLMTMSDAQSHWYQDNAQKVKHLIQVIDKNYDYDIQNYFTQRENFPKRKKAKQPIVGQKLLQMLGIVVIVFFVSNMLCLVMYNNLTSSQLTIFQTLAQLGHSITEVYSDMCDISNEFQHTGIIKEDRVKILMEKLDGIQKFRNRYLFSTSFNDQIETIYFKDSCSLLANLNITTESQCQGLTPNFLIQDPFNLGLSVYFRRMHYSIINNITETFASTGIYSKIFARLFINVAHNVQTDGSAKINSIFQILTIFGCIIILINGTYTIIALLVSFYLKNQVSKAKRLIIFLNIQDAKIIQKQSQEQKKQNNRKNTLLSKDRKSKISTLQSVINKNESQSQESVLSQ